ncbi:MAG: hypothetical protein N2688_07680 [Burkholderiaceae bacterium]|nr:hypothetical protein [Burkholderiaceae bacterium]
MAHFRDEPTETASDGDLAIVDAGVHRHNARAADLAAMRPFARLARDADGARIGMLRARVRGRARQVQQFLADKRHRRRDIGAVLVRRLNPAQTVR